MKMQRLIRKAFCSLKERTSVSCAKMATVGGFCDLDLVFIKATSPDDLPFNEKYVDEMVKTFSVSPASYREFALFFGRRFSNTESWRVALKSLLLLHRLLGSSPDKVSFVTELIWARSNKYVTLHPCGFQDYSSSAAEDYTSFIRAYAQFLDEAIDCSSIQTSDQVISFPGKIMDQVVRMIQVLPRLQSLTDRVMDCRPTGTAERSVMVQSAMKYIFRDSFISYTSVRKEIVLVLDNLIQLPHGNCVAAFDIYKKAAIQAKELCEFYDWSRYLGLCGAYEYPFVECIPLIQIRALGLFLNGMWQLTESSSSSSTMSISASNQQSPSTTSDGENEKQAREQELPLIDFDADDNVSWEDLLEASIGGAPDSRNKLLLLSTNANSPTNNYCEYQTNGSWQMQVSAVVPTNTSTNPFHRTHHHHYPNPTFPWGL